jgi:hypothetical protein
MKNILKNNHNYTPKQAPRTTIACTSTNFFFVKKQLFAS